MIRFILPALFWTVLVIVASVSPGSSFKGVNVFENFDKIIHFIMYGGMVFLWLVGLNRQNVSKILRVKSFSLSFFGSFVLSFILELIQNNFISQRHFDWFDLLSNFLGCIFGVILFKIIYKDSYKKEA